MTPLRARPVLFRFFLLATAMFAAGVLTSGNEAAGLTITRKTAEGWFDWSPRELETRKTSPHLPSHGSFRHDWIEISGLQQRAVEQKINATLARFAKPPPRAKTPPAGVPERGDEPTDDDLTCTVVAAGPEILSVVFDGSVRPGIDAPRWLCKTIIFHFDLQTGRELGLADFVEAEHFARLDAALREPTDDEEVAALPNEFAGIRADTPVYFRGGEMVVQLKTHYQSYAGDSFNASRSIPSEKIRAWLTPVGARLAEAARRTAGKD